MSLSSTGVQRDPSSHVIQPGHDGLSQSLFMSAGSCAGLKDWWHWGIFAVTQLVAAVGVGTPSCGTGHPKMPSLFSGWLMELLGLPVAWPPPGLVDCEWRCDGGWPSRVQESQEGLDAGQSSGGAG